MKIVEGNINKNRKFIESKNVDILYAVDNGAINDFLHSRNSGLNQVLLAIAKKNKVKIGFDFNRILRNKGRERALILGRMMQNVKLCRKYKVKMILLNNAKNKYEERSVDLLKNFGLIIGMTGEEAKGAII